MGVLDQPTSFFGGGFKIKGDLELAGEIIQEPPIKFGIDTETLDDTMALGVRAKATGDDSVSIGRDSEATRQRTTALGENARALGINATVVGNEAIGSANWNTVIGYDAGSFSNGENIVLIGRKVEAQGDDSVAIGESARANGQRTVALGKATSALGDESVVFGQSSSATSSGTTIIGQGTTINVSESTAIGSNVVINGSKSTAVGFDAEVSATNSTAVGNGVTVTQDDTFSFGDRNINVPENRSLLYPPNSGETTLVDFEITKSLSSGITQSYSLDIGGESVLVIASESDGQGGITNKRLEFPGNFNLPDGVNTFFGSNQDFGVFYDAQANSLIVEDSNGTELIRQSKNGNTEFTQDIDVGGSIVAPNTTIWDGSAQNITLSSLEENTISVNGGNGIKNGTEAILGNSISFDVNPSDISGKFIITDAQDNIGVNIGDGLTGSQSGSIQVDEDFQYSFTNTIEFQSSISIKDFQDLETISSDPPSPSAGVARLFVDGQQSPNAVKVIDSNGDVTTVVSLSE